MPNRRYNFTGEKPDIARIEELAASHFPRKPLSIPERNLYIKTASRFLIYSVCTFGIFAVIWVIVSYQGYFHTLTAVLAFLSLIASVVCFIIAVRELIKAIKEPRPKSPEAAIASFLKDVLIGSETTKFMEKSTEFAYQKLRRMTPDEIPIDREEFGEYIRGFRAGAFTFLAKMHHRYFGGELKERDLSEKYHILESICEEKGDGFVRLKMLIDADFRQWAIAKKGDKTHSYADLIISIEMTLVRAGKFWIIADPMPKWEDIMAEYEQIVQESIEKSGGE
jgi:hypothetical protein